MLPNGITYHEWAQSIASDNISLSFPTQNQEKDEKIVKTVQTNIASEKIQKLCRVCSSIGLISIKTSMNQGHLNFVPSGDKTAYDVPISEIIQQISGEQVSEDDNLPKFICKHCLGYLIHAYVIRLKIISTSANLRFAQEIAEDDSVYLEETQIDQTRITKREIEEKEEENNEEIHFNNQFKDANIKIHKGAAKYVQRAVEFKCDWCMKRVMSKKSLYDHMDNCEIGIVTTLLKQLQAIFSLRENTRLTSQEFVLHVIKIVFEAQKRLQKIVIAKSIDIDSITDELPVREVNQVNESSNWKPNNPNHRSPDNDLGYLSGGNSNFQLR